MKFCQPSASQSNSTHTRPSSLGSRRVCEPFEPCCFRFSRLVVEKTRHQRSKSSTLELSLAFAPGGVAVERSVHDRLVEVHAEGIRRRRSDAEVESLVLGA